MNRADAMRLSNLAGLGFYVHGDTYCDDVGLPRGTICTVQDVRIEYAERLIELAQAEVHKEMEAERQQAIAAAVMTEREACAKAVEDRGMNTKNGEWFGNHQASSAFATSIRARTMPAPIGPCWCSTCRPISMDMRMVLCPDCGNKRCPKAANHLNACTNSNEPGQPGSNYPKIQPAHGGAG